MSIKVNKRLSFCLVILFFCSHSKSLFSNPDVGFAVDTVNPKINFLNVCMDSAIGCNEDPCIISCSGKPIKYFATIHSGSNYEWHVVGGYIVGSNNTQSVEVVWQSGINGVIRLTEIFSSGDSTTIENCVKILDSPIADFSINPTEVCLNGPTYFIDQSIGAQDWFWDFGDGSTSSLQNPEHIYTALGTFVITLRVTRREIIKGFESCRFECECFDTIKKEITITSIGPSICISTVCVGDTSCYKVIKSCSTSSFIWTVDNHGIIIDGGGTQDTFICINWIDGEIGTITLLEQGCSGNYCNVPSIFEIPIIDINNLEIIGDTILCPGQTESYTIPKYMGTIYNWNVINGTINTPSPRSNNVNVTWSSIPGIGYLIVDIFHLEKGCISRDTIKVEINPSFSVLGQNKVCYNDTIKYYIPNLSGYTGDWIWNLTGGIVIGPSNRECIQILWNVPPGDYSISATPVDTSYYCILEASFLIKVFPKPAKPFLSSGPLRICAGGTYIYSAVANPIEGEIYWLVQNGTVIPEKGGAVTITWDDPYPPSGYSISIFQVSVDEPYCHSDTSIYPVELALTEIDIEGQETVCINSTSTYHATFIPSPYSQSGEEIKWTINPEIYGTIISGQNTGDIEVQWNNNPGTAFLIISQCEIIDTLKITVVPPPQIVITAPTELCKGTTGDVTIFGNFKNITLSNYFGLVNPIAIDPIYNVPAGEYIFEAIDINTNCTIKETIQIDEIKIDPQIVALGPLEYSLCKPLNTTLGAFQSPGVSYQWQSNCGGGWSNMPGETNFILNLIGISMDCSYRCILTKGICIEISNVINISSKIEFFNIVSNGPTTFCEIPNIIPINVSLSVAYPLPTGSSYQWQVNCGGTVWNDLIGENSPILIQNNVSSNCSYRAIIPGFDLSCFQPISISGVDCTPHPPSPPSGGGGSPGSTCSLGRITGKVLFDSDNNGTGDIPQIACKVDLVSYIGNIVVATTLTNGFGEFLFDSICQYTYPGYDLLYIRQTNFPSYYNYSDQDETTDIILPNDGNLSSVDDIIACNILIGETEDSGNIFIDRKCHYNNHNLDFTFDFCNSTINFQHTSSNVNDLTWDFGDGSIETASGTTIQHSYGLGTFEVCLSGTIPATDPVHCPSNPIKICKFVDIPLVISFENKFISCGALGCSNYQLKEDYKIHPNYHLVSIIYSYLDPVTTLPVQITGPNPIISLCTACDLVIPINVEIMISDGFGHDCIQTVMHNLNVSGTTPSGTIPPTVCQFEAIQFFDNNSCGAAEWLWDFGDGSQSKLENPFKAFSTTGTKAITLTTYDKNGCISKTNFIGTISVLPLPNILLSTIPSPSLLCEGDTGIFQATPGFVDYHWTNLADGTDFHTNIDHIEVYETVGYFVEATDINGCKNTSSKEFIKFFPLPKFKVSGSTEICVGETLNLQVTPGFNYLWTINNGLLSSSTTNTFLVSNLAAGNYTITLTVTDLVSPNCSTIELINFVVHPLPSIPQISILPSPPIPLCEGLSIEIIVENPNPNYLYIWSTGFVGTTLILNPSYSGIVFLEVIDLNTGCKNRSMSYTIHPLPDVCVVPVGCYEKCNSDTICIPDYFKSYQWLKDGVPIIGATDSCLIVLESGKYQVVLETNNGCIDTSGLIEYTILHCYCDSVSAKLEQDIVNQDSCCFFLSIQNNYNGNFFKGLEIEGTWLSQTLQLQPMNGWLMQFSSSYSVVLNPPQSTIILGNDTCLRVCPLPSSSGPNLLTIDWLVPYYNGCIDACKDSVYLDCPIPVLSCDDHINVSLDSSCCAYITPEMILEGNYPLSCLKVDLKDKNGIILPSSPKVTGAQIGQLITVELIDTCTKNRCWGTLTVEDKLPPRITCQNPDTVFCNNTSYQWSPPIVRDNCTDIATVHIITDNTIKKTCDSFCIAERQIQYYYTDFYGNHSDTCIKKICYKKLDWKDIKWPSDTLFSCEFWTSPPSPTHAGIPTGGGKPLYPSWGECKLAVTYEDQIITICPKSFKVLRKWTVIDWCKTSPNNVAIHYQVIKVVDEKGPVILCSPDITISTDVWTCTGTAIIPPPKVIKECSDSVSIEVSYKISSPNGPTKIGTSLNNIKLLPNGYYSVTGLPHGLNWVSFVVTDGCGNSSECFTEVIVIDQVPPVAVCDQKTVVTLTIDGTAKIEAYTFDDGSHDNCMLDRFEVKRMDNGVPCSTPNGDQWGPYVFFCCKDIGKTIMVSLQVWDKSGNSNTCMVEVVVQDKIAPVIFCPPNITVSCTFDYSDVKVFGNVVTDISLRKPIVINDPGLKANGPLQDGYAYDGCGARVNELAPRFNLKCGSGTITRNFEAIDSVGLRSYCTQTITIQDIDPANVTVQWPRDFTSNTVCANVPDLNPNVTGMPRVIGADACNQIVTTHTDQLFELEPDACIKILRKWIILDWCIYDPNASNPRGYWTWVQNIKVTNTVGPVFTSSCADRTIETFGPGCGGRIELRGLAKDDCTDSSRLVWYHSVDINNDGVSPGIEYLFSGPGNDASNIYPLGKHKITYLVKDACGNESKCSFIITVVDKKKPTPYCVTSITTTVMPSSKEIEIWAKDFNLNSEDNCTPKDRLQYFFKVNNSYQTSMKLTCANIGQNSIKVYVVDEYGNEDYCEVTLILQDPNKVCGTSNLVSNGQIRSTTGQIMPEISVKLVEADQVINKSKTNSQGVYAFQDLIKSHSYTINPTYNENPSNGVSTQDILMIQKHILGVKQFDSPFQYIAADVNKTSTITAADISEIRKLILGVIPQFSKNDSWRFVSKSHVFKDLHSVFPF